ncbi:MAG: bifunctional non-ous end joining protein LigD [Blastocatellia bacterium]|jgi:bifunctional non-homologous end joining protein LigD|nr:bifunctional non-ous end joining protein LigD [Blastocatellia bacterium]
MAAKIETVTIGKRRIELSHLDKLLYPGKKFTKAKVIDYYIRIAPYLLPHLKNRPVTLKRYPEGVFGEFFYEKEAPAFTPQWVKTFPVPRRERMGEAIRYIVINDLPTLVWLANLANLEIHPFLHRVPRRNRPTAMVFDCDPGEGADVLSCARVALNLRDVLQELHLDSYAKVSGSKGLQVYVPLNSAVSYEQTSAFGKAIAELLEQREPNLIVSQMPKRLRTKKVFIDWSQNAEFKTTVGVYSLRAKTHRPYVSVPVEWDELAEALKKKNAKQLFFSPEEAIARAEELGDLFEPVLKQVQKLPGAVRQFFELSERHKQKSVAARKPYIPKRNPETPAEAKPVAVQRSKQGSRRRFVIHKHNARGPQYEFRLELHGILKSWSIPKGFPFKKGEKRLAMSTEDQPIEYLDFEGIIPKGQFGGIVMVWDIGTYELIEGNYFKGLLHFYLKGMKLKGEWTIQRLPGEKIEKGSPDKWQLIKTDKNTRPASKNPADKSALSNRTMSQIARAEKLGT